MMFEGELDTFQENDLARFLLVNLKGRLVSNIVKAEDAGDLEKEARLKTELEGVWDDEENLSQREVRLRIISEYPDRLSKLED